MLLRTPYWKWIMELNNFISRKNWSCPAAKMIVDVMIWLRHISSHSCLWFYLRYAWIFFLISRNRWIQLCFWKCFPRAWLKLSFPVVTWIYLSSLSFFLSWVCSSSNLLSYCSLAASIFSNSLFVASSYSYFENSYLIWAAMRFDSYAYCLIAADCGMYSFRVVSIHFLLSSMSFWIISFYSLSLSINWRTTANNSLCSTRVPADENTCLSYFSVSSVSWPDRMSSSKR